MGMGMPYVAEHAVQAPWRSTEEPKAPGRLLWVAAPSGMGKTATCKALCDTHGFVHYEGDCFFGCAEQYPGQSPPGPYQEQQNGSGTLYLPDVDPDRVQLSKEMLGAVIAFI